MAHQVRIKNPGGSFVDYTNFVFLPDEIAGGGQSIVGGGTSQTTQQVTLVKNWELGQPPTCQFFLGGDLLDLDAFEPPKNGAEVWIDSDTFPNFFTGFLTNEAEVVPVGSPGVSDDPADQLYGYVCSCQGHEILLNLDLIGFIPPFTNMTTGDIIAALGEMLLPGRFDWSSVEGFGDFIPIYRTQPTQRFFDVVNDLFNNQATKLWFVRYKAFIAHYDEGDPSVEPTIFETDVNANPNDLTITPLQTAIVNDVTGIGDTEPQVYVSERSVGDGITTSYALKLPVFGALGKPVIEDDFTASAFDNSIWEPFGVTPSDSSDPSNAFQLFNGRLSVVGGLGLNTTKLLSALGIEIKGSVNIDAGEFQFVDATDAIVGALYSSETLSLANCIFGFRITGGGGSGTGTISGEHPSGTVNGTNVTFFTSQVPASGFTLTVNGVPQILTTDYTLVGNVITFVTPPPLGATVLASYTYNTGGGVGISIQAIENGALVGSVVTTKPNMTYSLHIRISTPVQQTYLPPWYSSNSPFGGGSKSAPVTASFLVEEYSQLAVRLPNEFHVFQDTLTGVADFLFLGEFAINNANFAVNYFQVTTPIQGTLLTQLVSDDNPKIRTMGFVGQSDADATISVTDESATLTFFKESRPILRQRNEFRYRSAGPAVARVVSGDSIAAEATRYGDSGHRSALLTQINPLPATAEQLEWALQAYLDDNDSQQFEGVYTAIVPPSSLRGLVGSPGAVPAFAKPMLEPIPGRFINVHYPNRTPETPAGFSELIKVVQISVLAENDNGSLEQFEVDISYGLVLTREMSKILTKFSIPDPPSVAVQRQITNVPEIDTTLVGTQFIEDAPNFALADYDTANFYYDIGQNLLSGEQVEVRFSDASWGQTGGANFIGRFNARTFSLPRKIRDQTVYAKIVNGSTPSRYASMVRMLYPLVPPQPAGSETDASTFATPKIHFDLPPTTLDIFGILIQSQRTVVAGNITLASDGADSRDVLVAGQDASGNYISERIALNGTTPVTTTKVFNWILWVNSDYETTLNEVPSPQTDGTTTNFNLAGNPVAGSITVYVDGTAATVGVDFNIVGNQIQFVNPPTSGSQILVNYISLEVTSRTVLISGPGGPIGSLLPGNLQWLANPILYRYEDLSFGGSNQDPALTFTFDNSAEQTTATLYVYFYNLLDELSLPYTITPAFGNPPSTQPGVECLDVRTFGAKGDGQTNDTLAVQAALDQAALNLNAPTNPVTTPTVIARPTVDINGWGANAHVGLYEHGTNQGRTWTTDPGTTLSYSNPSSGIDGDDTTFASTVQQHTHQYSGIVYKFAAVASPSPPTAQRYLKIDSGIPANGDGGIIITDRSAGAWYSLDGGSTWKMIYDASVRARQTDSILLPPGQDISKVKVEFFSDSHDDMAQYIWDVRLEQLEPVGSQIQAAGPTTVCIPSGVNCMVGGLVDEATLPSSQFSVGGANGFALNIQSGVTLKIDGSLNLFDYTGLTPGANQFVAKGLIASATGSNDIHITGTGSINGNAQPGTDQIRSLIKLQGHDFTIDGGLTISQFGGAVAAGSPVAYTIHSGVAIELDLDTSNTNTTLDSLTFKSVYNPILIAGSVVGSPANLAAATFTNGVTISHCIADPCFYSGIRISKVQKLLIQNCRFSLIGETGLPALDGGGISISDIKNFIIENNICLLFDSGYVPLESGGGIVFYAGSYGCSDGLVTKNTCNNNNSGIAVPLTTSAWVRIEVSFNICNNNRTDGISMGLASGAQFNIHDNSATGNGNANIEPTAAQITSFAGGGNDTTGYSADNVNVTGAASVRAGVVSNNSNLGGINAQSGNYTLVAGDQGKLVRYQGSGNQTWTLPTSGLASTFACGIENHSTNGILTLTSIDGGSLPLNPGEGIWAFWDGGGWSSIRGASVGRFAGVIDSTAQTGSFSQTLVSPGVNSLWQVALNLVIASATALTAITLSVTWTDDNSNVQSASFTNNFGSGNGWLTLNESFYAKGGTNIVVAVSGITGTVSYKVHARALNFG